MTFFIFLFPLWCSSFPLRKLCKKKSMSISDIFNRINNVGLSPEQNENYQNIRNNNTPGVRTLANRLFQ